MVAGIMLNSMHHNAYTLPAGDRVGLVRLRGQMNILTIYNIVEDDINIKLQQASPDELSLQRIALQWAMPYGIVEPETTSDMDEDQQASYIANLASDQVARLFKALHGYLNDGAGAGDPRIILRKADG